MSPRRIDPLKQEIARLAFLSFVAGQDVEGAPDGYEFHPVDEYSARIRVKADPRLGPRYFLITVKEQT